MILMLLGPVSSASPNGQGPFFSWLILLVAGYVLVSTWTNYVKRRRETKIPILNLIGVTAIATLAIVEGILGLLH
jgi:hypothetical protein